MSGKSDLTKTAAVGVMAPAECKITVKQAINRAKIDFFDFQEIEDLVTRRIMTGSILLGIKSLNRKDKVVLANRMEEALRDTDMRVTMRQAHMRFLRIEESMRPEKINEVVAKKRQCQSSNIKVSSIHMTSYVLCTMVVQFLAETTRAIALDDRVTGTVRIKVL